MSLLLRAECSPSRTGARPSGRRGAFTLVEMLAAMVFIGILVPVLSEAVSASLNAASVARGTAEAAALAESKLNELLSNSSWLGESQSGDFSPERPEFRWTVSSTIRQGTLKEVTVLVIWSARGTERVESLTTLLYRGTTQ